LEKGHGRIETRRARFLETTPEAIDFPHAASIIELERCRCHRDSTETVERVYLISSLAPEGNRKRIFKAVRAHWGVENKVHYRRDYSYNEDRDRIRTPKHAHAMASLRNLVIGLFDHRQLLFENNSFRSLPHLHEHFAANSRLAINWITQRKAFLL
jgi:predicted transposase YbfD/YdcC